MTCRHCVGAGDVFNDRRARRELHRYRGKGPDKTTRVLLEALQADGFEGRTLLDVGGGIGVIQHEVLGNGGEGAVSADASPAYMAAAQDEARRLGFGDRVRYHLGDFIDHAEELEDADLVTLNRVICCYPEMERLVSLSAAKARKLYGIVFPRDEWWIRLVLRLPNLFFRLTRNPFRVFVHPTESVRSVLAESGLQERFYKRTLVWQVAVFERV